MKLVVLDSETYFADDFTLSKMTTEAYVRDPRFEAHGAAVKWSPSVPARWYDEKELRFHLSNTDDWHDTMLICHHAAFDGLILAHHYGVRPKFWGDTLSMARYSLGNHLPASLEAVRKHFGMPGKSTPYNLFKGKHWHELSPAVQKMVADGAVDEVESIWKIFGILVQQIPREELEVIDTTIRMFTEPCLRADVPLLGEIWQRENTKKIEMMESIGVTSEELQSADKFAALLREAGVEPGTKPSPKDPDKQIYAFAKTDQAMRDLLEDPDPYVQALAMARLGVKSSAVQTRCETYGYMAQRGPLCVYLNMYGAHTRRWSAGDGSGWQNLKRADPDGPKQIRDAILPPEGFIMLDPDLSQIECVAEGQIVLTDKGSKAIQDVKLDDRVWDGTEFVAHEGVVFKGVQEVISYQGLTCTPEHVVYPRGNRLKEGVQMQVAAALGLDIQAADRADAVCQTKVRSAQLCGVQNVWSAWHRISVQVGERIRALCAGAFASSHLRWRRDRSQRQRRPLRTWKFEAINAARKCQQSVHDFLGAYCWWSLGYAGLYPSTPRMRLPSGSDQGFGRHRFNWRADNRPIQKQLFRNDMEERKLQARPAQRPEVRKAKVYDIVNAGPRYRFMVSGVIVSNCRILSLLAGQEDAVQEFRDRKDPYCRMASAVYGFEVTKAMKKERGTGKQLKLSCGYQAGAKTIQRTARLGIYGPPVVISEEEALRWRDIYRKESPMIVDYWATAGRMLARLAGGPELEWGPFTIKDKRLYLTTNKLYINYETLEYHVDETGEGNWRFKTRRGWSKLYSGKLVENIVQFAARVVASQAMIRIRQLGYRIVNTEHDKHWVLVPKDGREAEHARVIRSEMVRDVPWLPGLPIDCECELPDGA